jgi:hypothetical protein
MTNENRNTATPNLAQRTIERVSMTNDKDSEVLAELLGTMRERCTDPCRSEKAELGCDCDAARRAAVMLRQPTQSEAWQPIETYKRGNALFYCPAITDARHSGNNKPEYYTFDRPLHRPPTHWRPLNPPLNAALQEQSK